MALNKITIHGYLGREPELKEYTNAKGETGKLVNLSVGVSRRDEGTDWFEVTMFGKRAEVIEKWFSKGSQIVISGRMQSSVNEKDGVKRKYWKLIADDFDFCDSQDSPRGQSSAPKTEPAANNGADSFEDAEEDIPF